MIASGLALTISTIVFLLILALLGVYTMKWVGHSEDYLIASREISFLVTATSILAIGFASDITSMYSIFSVYYGYWAAVALGVVYIGWMVYGIYFSKFVRSVGTFTIGEWYGLRFNVQTRVLMSIVLTLAVVFVGAAGIQGMAQMLYGFAGWPIMASIAGMLAIIGIVMVTGGIWGVSITSFVQTIFGYVVLPIVFIYLLAAYGGVDWLQVNMPESSWRLSFPGNFQVFALTENSYITWVMMWFFALIFGSPYYWLRAVAARSDKVARDGYVVAGILGLILMSAIMPLIGLYAISINPEMFTPFGGPVDPAGALGVLASNIPAVLGLFIMLGMLAATISTYTTTAIGGIAAISRDVYQGLLKPKATPKEMLLPTRVFTVLFILVTWFAATLGNVIFLMGVFLSFVGISSTLVVLAFFWRRLTSEGAFWGALVSIVLTIIWAWSPGLLAISHQSWVAVGSTLIISILVSLATKPKYYGQSNWTPTSYIKNTEETDLSQLELSILKATKIGANRFADFIDSLQLDGVPVNKIVESLEQNGYIYRQGSTGANFYCFSLTDKGIRAVEKRSEESEKHLMELGLNFPVVKVLKALKAEPVPVTTEQLALRVGYNSLEVVPILSAISRRGLIKDSGILRKRVALSQAGTELLEKIGPEDHDTGVEKKSSPRSS